MAKSGNPTKAEAIALKQRNEKMIKMSLRYPVDYLAIYFNISEGRVSQIIKKSKK